MRGRIPAAGTIPTRGLKESARTSLPGQFNRLPGEMQKHNGWSAAATFVGEFSNLDRSALA